MTRQPTAGDWQITSVTVGADVFEYPAWEEVHAAIQSLDESQRRSVAAIEAADGSLLLVGGGNGRLTLQLTYPRGANPEILVLTDSSRGTKLESLIVDGIDTDLPAYNIVDESKALQAARSYYESGDAGAVLGWEEG